ncbi:MAG: exodeoxyribonuclease III [Alphaproteobacteria bacterium]
MKIVSWNINSIKARGEHVKRYLTENAPDVLMAQELKGLEFPHNDFEGYHTHAVPQKAYNGVAVFSKSPITLIAESLKGDETDEQARYIEFETNGVRLINIYLPNGNPVPGDKYDYKLSWMERLYTRLKDLTDNDTPFIIGGDFNVIPDDKDCHAPKDWAGDALFRPETHKAWRKLLNLGLTDAFRVFNTAAQQYTFWDYQAGAWQKNNGIRIDHFLLSPLYADRLISCTINKSPREWERPSDHTPIELVIK